jgi:GTP-binding protein EngB required for normal cell division
MKTKQINTNFVKWLSAEEMHNDSKDWLLELKFLNDEYLFFEDLIKWNTLQLIDFQSYSKSKEIIENFSASKNTNDELIKLIQKHENNLQVVVDDVDDLKEEAYKKEHKTLLILLKNHVLEHRALKLHLFDILKKIKKTEKQKRLIALE